MKRLRTWSIRSILLLFLAYLLLGAWQFSCFKSAKKSFDRAERAFYKGFYWGATATYEECMKEAQLASYPFATIQREEREVLYLNGLWMAGDSARLMGDTAKAVSYLEQGLGRAVKFRSQSPDIPAMFELTLGDALQNLDPPRAAAYHSSTLSWAQSKDQSTWTWVLFKLAEDSLAAGDFKSTQLYLDKIKELGSALDKRVLTKVLLAEAQALVCQQKYKEAEEHLPDAIKYGDEEKAALFEEDLLHTVPRVMAVSLMKQKKYADARSYILGLMPVVGHECLVTAPQSAEYYTYAGWYNEGVGNKDDAIELFSRAVENLEDLRYMLPQAGRIGFFRNELRLLPYKHLGAILADSASDLPVTRASLTPYGRTCFEAALHFAEATKARVFMEQLASLRQATLELPALIPDELRSKERDAVSKVEQAELQLEEILAVRESEPGKFDQEGGRFVYIPPKVPPEVAKAHEKLQAAKKDLKTLVGELYQRSPRYATLRYPRPIPLAEVPLEKDELVLEYSLGDESSLLFLVGGSGLREVIPIEAGRAQLEDLVHQYLEIVKRGTPFDPRHGSELSRLLLAGAQQRLPPGTRLIVIPDGILWNLPFELLPIPGDPSAAVSLGDRLAMSYAPSLAVLSLNRLAPTATPSKRFFGLGDPTFSESATEDHETRRGVSLRRVFGQQAEYVLPPLPETRDEVLQAARLFGVRPAPPDILLGRDASESQLRVGNLVDYRIVHFATHGITGRDIAGIREPALILSQTDPPNDGLLTASEVLTLSLGRSLVILSACKTGLGEEFGGEGIMSLGWTFQQAGAESVVMSLWEVPSEATRDLFNSFYENLSSGKAVGESLQDAKREVRRRFPAPLYWSGFILMGEYQGKQDRRSRPAS